jgi:hypothetical protein
LPLIGSAQKIKVEQCHGLSTPTRLALCFDPAARPSRSE